MELNKNYFVDFFFPEIGLVVELDGKQHEPPDQKEADRIRDEYITNKLGYRVIRITHNQYIAGNRVEEVTNLLRG